MKQKPDAPQKRGVAKNEIKTIRKSFPKELEIFCHGALCVSMSGSCLFSSFLGGRSGNRGKCAQPCRKPYNRCFYLSTKELCLIQKIPEIISLGVNALKIEGRMRTPYYVAAVTESYRKAIDSYYSGNFTVTEEMLSKLQSSFSRGFTSGWFDSSKDIFNRQQSCAQTVPHKKDHYKQASTYINVRPKVNKS